MFYLRMHSLLLLYHPLLMLMHSFLLGFWEITVKNSYNELYIYYHYRDLTWSSISRARCRCIRQVTFEITEELLIKTASWWPTCWWHRIWLLLLLQKHAQYSSKTHPTWNFYKSIILLLGTDSFFLFGDSCEIYFSGSGVFMMLDCSVLLFSSVISWFFCILFASIMFCNMSLGLVVPVILVGEASSLSFFRFLLFCGD